MRAFLVTEYFSHYKHLYFLSGIFQGLFLERINLQLLVNEAAALLKVPEFVMCLGHRQARTRTEGEAQLSSIMMEASVLMVFGHWESACSSWQGQGGFLVNVSLFPSTNLTPVFIKQKTNPSHVHCLLHGLK